MNQHELKKTRRLRRRRSVRRKVCGTPDRPRLSVFRSLKNISVQLVDDISGRTLCSAGTLSKQIADEVKAGGNCKAAVVVGRTIGERARMQGIRKITFDRNGYRYHGRVKALAEAMRKTGLEF
ncbi:MAG: 50S ribosomal protein L18 [Planctomycetota bacterium]